MGKKRERRTAPAAEKQPLAATSRILLFLEKHARAIAIAAVLLASLRIVATYTVFNHTCDEPAHIACGVQWWDKGVYTCEPQHPPLARMAVGIGPYVAGAHSEPIPSSSFADITREGFRILYGAHRYDLILTTARLGNLPLFWVACVVVYVWGSRYYNHALAAVAVCMFTFLPPILAHAGLATTDMAITAFLGAAFLTGLIWLEHPTPARSALFALCTGLAFLSKFSFLVFFPATVALAAIVYLVVQRPAMSLLFRKISRLAGPLALSVLICCLVIWAGYRFSFGKVNFASVRLPAPELYAGVQRVIQHNDQGHASYFLGQRRTTGWWYFFPVLTAVKTPLGFLILLLAWAFLAVRRSLGFPLAWLPAASRQRSSSPA